MKHRKDPLSPKQLAANRANAQHSTGPRTPEGKAASARNAVRHGFAAASFNVIRLESFDELARIKDDLVAAYQPVNSQELFAVERMAIAQQSILRAGRLEAGLFNVAISETMWNMDAAPGCGPHQDLQNGVPVSRVQNRNFFVAEGLHLMTQKSNSWSLFLRYQTQAERLYRRALDEFERVKALRPEMPVEDIANDGIPNEPDPPLQPKQNTPDTRPETNPSAPPPPPEATTDFSSPAVSANAAPPIPPPAHSNGHEQISKG